MIDVKHFITELIRVHITCLSNRSSALRHDLFVHEFRHDLFVHEYGSTVPMLDVRQFSGHVLFCSGKQYRTY